MTDVLSLSTADRLALYRFLFAAARASAPSRTPDWIGAAVALEEPPDVFRQLLDDVCSTPSDDEAVALIAGAAEPLRHLALVYLEEMDQRMDQLGLQGLPGGPEDWGRLYAFRLNAQEALTLPEEQRSALLDLGLTARHATNGCSFLANWDVPAFVEAGVDPVVVAAALPEEGGAAVAEYFRREAREAEAAARSWDSGDWGLVLLAALAGALTDVALVRIPKTLKTGEYAGQAGTPLTERLHGLDGRPGMGGADAPAWFQRFAGKAAEWEAGNKVPFDRCVAGFDGEARWVRGMYPRSHRLQTPAHDPVLGLFYGVRDILQGRLTAFEYDSATGLHRLVRGEVMSHLDGPTLVEALLTWAHHLLSDVATPMGLPTPLFTALQAFNVGSFGEKGRTVAEVARWMYLNGYDLRHFVTMGTTPATVEALLRAGVMLKRYREEGAVTLRLARDPKYRAMRLAAHGAAATANAVKVGVTRNPLAINQAQWMALGRYLLPEGIRWVLGRLREEADPLGPIREAGWLDLGANARRIVAVAGSPVEEPLLATDHTRAIQSPPTLLAGVA